MILFFFLNVSLYCLYFDSKITTVTLNEEETLEEKFFKVGNQMTPDPPKVEPDQILPVKDVGLFILE